MQQQEISKLCLRVITPINISDGTILGAKDYLYDPKKQKAYFLNIHAWHKFIYEHKLLQDYEDYIIKDRKNNLLTWLKGKNFSIDDVSSVIINVADVKVNTLDVTKKQTANDIHRHIRHLDGKLYIPGSSIKGVFRTAILYNLLQKKKKIKEAYWQQVEQKKEILRKAFDEKANPRNIQIKDVKDAGKSLERMAQRMETELLHTLIIKDTENGNVVCSAMRGLQVSDSYASKNLQTAVLQKVDGGLDRYDKASQHAISVFRECMLPRTELYFDVKLEKAFTATIGINSIDELLDITRQFFKAVFDLLEKAFGNEYKKEFAEITSANMFIGANTGFLSKTLIAMLAPNGEKAKDVIKVLLQNSFKDHKHIIKDKKISPRTLKCTRYDGKLFIMGAAEVRKV